MKDTDFRRQARGILAEAARRLPGMQIDCWKTQDYSFNLPVMNFTIHYIEKELPDKLVYRGTADAGFIEYNEDYAVRVLRQLKEAATEAVDKFIAERDSSNGEAPAAPGPANPGGHGREETDPVPSDLAVVVPCETPAPDPVDAGGEETDNGGLLIEFAGTIRIRLDGARRT